MRLLNTTRLEFQEVLSTGLLRNMEYAILSHRWGDEEVSYEEFVLAQQVDEHPDWWPSSVQGQRVKEKAGYTKITDFCSVAKKQYNLDWCWVDTCCIDKRSSAELSEAINSMWKWYEYSSACFVYMSDVKPAPDPLASENDHAWSTFRDSSWLTRCWTLQELLAPRFLCFFTRDWVEFGRMNRGSVHPYRAAELRDRLVQETARATRIPEPFLTHSSHRWLPGQSIAQRMNLAAGRRATRIEDVAYSLLGLFDINMPLLYGEGHKAFLRLQHEILRQTHDSSIFAWNFSDRMRHACWGRRDNDQNPCKFPVVLAPDPDCFAEWATFCNCLTTSDASSANTSRVPYAITNLGLDITVDCEVMLHSGPESVGPIVLIFATGSCPKGTCGSPQHVVAVTPIVDARKTPMEALNSILEAANDPLEIWGRVLACRSGDELRRVYPPDTSRGMRRLRLLLPIRNRHRLD